MEKDPDYDYDISQESLNEEDTARKLEQNARNLAVERIQTIIKQQFAQEIAAKEREVTLITERLTEVRHILDRLRACVVASHYASSFAKPIERNKIERGAAEHPAIKNVLRKAVTAVLSKNVPPDVSTVQNEAEQSGHEAAQSNNHAQSSPKTKHKEFEERNDLQSSLSRKELQDRIEIAANLDDASQEYLGGRHRVKKKIIVGNISKYIAPDKREGNDNSTHKWMVYVRGGADEPKIDHFVRKVWFFLHPSYRPNDLVEVTEAPFHLTRRGWGEFPIRVQLHFCDPRNRRVDIIHHLCLDRTYTGLQTLGAETVCEIELDRSTIGLRVENLLDEQAIVGVTHANDIVENLEDENANIDAASKLESASHLDDKELNSAVKDVLNDLIDKVQDADEKESAEAASPAAPDAMEVDEEADDAVEEKDMTSPSSVNERKRRRRRGDSCTQSEAETVDQSLALRLLRADDVVEEEIITEGPSVSIPSLETDTVAEVLNTTAETLLTDEEVSPAESTKDVDNIADTVDHNENSELQKANVASTPLPDHKLTSDTAVASNARTSAQAEDEKSPVKSIPSTEETSELDESDKPKHHRSSSSNSDSLNLSTTFLRGKVLYVKKPSAGVTATTSTVNTKPSSSVVVLRPRAASSDLTSRKYAHTNKGNITVLTPVKSGQARLEVSGSLAPVSKKRSFSSSSTSSRGTLVFNVVPEKQRKLTESSANDNSRSSSPKTTRKIAFAVTSLKSASPSKTTSSLQNAQSLGKMSLSIVDSKQQSLPSTLASTKEVFMHSGASGSTIIPSQIKTARVTPDAETVASSMSKSYVLKNTKQGLVVVTKESRLATEHKGLVSTSSAVRGSAYPRPQSAEAIPSIRLSAQPSSPTDNKTFVQEVLQKPMKSVSQQQVLTVKALQAALQRAGVNLNRPMQIKVDKVGGSQTSSKNQQQFVLTSITNDQGKPQLALVNVDRVKPPLEGGKMRDNAPTSCLKAKGSTIKTADIINHVTPRLPSANSNEGNIPFHKVVANAIVSRTVKDLTTDALPIAARHVPLVRQNRDISLFPFCAESEAEFLEWNIGKQRAAEMQRATLIQKILSCVRQQCDAVKDAPLPSKRFIMDWCLSRGYSVFTDEFEASEESELPDEDSHALDGETSITRHDKLIAELEQTAQSKITPIKNYDDIDEIDIVSVTPPKVASVKVEPGVSAKAASKPRSCITPTIEMEAIEKMAKEVDVKFDDISVAEGLEAPLCQVVLAKALQLFTHEVTREALHSALVRRDGEGRIQRILPEKIDCLDLMRALGRLDKFNILTDAHLGVET